MVRPGDPRSVHGKTVSVDAETDLLVVGGGPAGFEAALFAARCGVLTRLVDEHPIDPALMAMDVPHHFGSRYGREVANTRDLTQTIAQTYDLAFDAGVEVELGTAVLGIYIASPSLGWLPGNLALLESRGKCSLLRFRNAIIAAGCRDFSLAFPGWETPGVMGAAAANVLIRRYSAFAAKTIVVLGSGIEALQMVRQAQTTGAKVAAIVEVSDGPRGGSSFASEMARREIPILANTIPLGVDSNIDGVIALHVGSRDGVRKCSIACDTVVNAIESVPNIELLAAAGAAISYNRDAGGLVSVLTETFETTLSGVYAVGDCAGTSQHKLSDVEVSRREARIAAAALTRPRGQTSEDAGRMPGPQPEAGESRSNWVAALRTVTVDTYVCQCEEVTADDIRKTAPPRYVRRISAHETGLARLASSGILQQDQVKRITRAGMGLCQGRRCREQVAEIIADDLNRDIAESGLPNYRVPVRPIPLSVLADNEEPASITENWVSWFGIPDQYKPYWEMSVAAPIRNRGCAPAGASVVIIGGGVTGLSAAWWLSRHGIRTLVLEAGAIGNEASGRNGGGSAAFHSPLFPEAEALWPQMDQLLGYPTEFRAGRLKIVRSEAQRLALASAKDAARHIGCQVEELDPKQLAEIAPLAGQESLGGIFFHGGGHMNPQRALHAYAWAVEDLGGRIMQRTAATAFRVSGGRIVEVETNRGRFGCDAIVVAAGTQTGSVCELLGAQVPVAPARAEMVLTEALPLMPFTNVDGNGLYGRQTLRGNLAYGGGPHEWLQMSPAEGLPKSGSPLVRNIAKRIAELLPRAAHARVIRSWAGFIECTPDGRPIIDYLMGIDNAVVATMSSVGFGLSPATGRAIMELLRYGRCSFADISSFSLSRFANLDRNWREERGWVSAASVATSREPAALAAARI